MAPASTRGWGTKRGGSADRAFLGGVIGIGFLAADGPVLGGIGFLDHAGVGAGLEGVGFGFREGNFAVFAGVAGSIEFRFPGDHFRIPFDLGDKSILVRVPLRKDVADEKMVDFRATEDGVLVGVREGETVRGGRRGLA